MELDWGLAIVLWTDSHGKREGELAESLSLRDHASPSLDVGWQTEHRIQRSSHFLNMGCAVITFLLQHKPKKSDLVHQPSFMQAHVTGWEEAKETRFISVLTGRI